MSPESSSTSPHAPGDPDDPLPRDDVQRTVAEVAAPDEADEEQSDGLLAARGEMIGVAGPARWPARGWPKALAALAYPRFGLLWAAALCSTMGMWMQNVAKAWLVYTLAPEETAELWLGIEAFALGLPVVLLIPFGGVLADHLSRRWILAGTNLLQCALALLLAVLTWLELIAVWHIVAISVVYGCLLAAGIPAMQSLIPSLVGDRELPNAVALNSIQFNLSRALGPALGGVVLVQLGATWSFALNALTYLPIAILLIVIAMPPVLRHKQTMLESLRRGVGYVLHRRDLLGMLGIIILTGTCIAPTMTMLPSLVEKGFGRDASGFSMLLSCFGLGALCGAALMAWRSDRQPTPWRALPLLVANGACSLALSLTGSFPLAAACVFLTGATFTGTTVRIWTAILVTTPDAMRGRVTSFQVVAFRTGIPLGSLLAGMTAGWLGVRSAFAAAGLTLLLVVPLLMLAIQRRNAPADAAEESPALESPHA